LSQPAGDGIIRQGPPASPWPSPLRTEAR
jgi:hypothetical protein